MSAGFARTDSGRQVYDTGKVLIGLRAGETGAAPRLHGKAVPQGMSADAEAIQSALLRKDESDHAVDRLLKRWGPPAIVVLALLIYAGWI